VVPPEETTATGFAHAGIHELRKEAYTMALYVAVCLLAASAAVSASFTENQVSMLALVWGTTVGLALAHMFAFHASARFVGAGTLARHDLEISVAQLIGAMAVAAICTVPILLFPANVELETVRLVLAGFIGAVAYTTARGNGATKWRAFFYGLTLLLVALAIALAKNLLTSY
jgi:hypothetical protein